MIAMSMQGLLHLSIVRMPDDIGTLLPLRSCVVSAAGEHSSGKVPEGHCEEGED
jgi:hypothetical protein